MAKFVYDDACGFCTWWASFFEERTDLALVGFSKLTDEEQDRLPEEWRNCAHLLTDQEVHSCGAAIEQALVRSDIAPWADEVFGFLRQFEDYERLREWLYREAADRRALWGKFVSEEPPARRE